MTAAADRYRVQVVLDDRALDEHVEHPVDVVLGAARAGEQLAEQERDLVGRGRQVRAERAVDRLERVLVAREQQDIEEDPSASAEMRQKLASAGLGGASIPVLDIGGTILVGFSTTAVDRALERTLRK